MDHTLSDSLLKKNERWIPGGVVSLNRKSEPHICFTTGKGSRVKDIDGNEYIDYQGGFAAVFLGHNDKDVNDAVVASAQLNEVLMSAGPTATEGAFAPEKCCSEEGGQHETQTSLTHCPLASSCNPP